MPAIFDRITTQPTVRIKKPGAPSRDYVIVNRSDFQNPDGTRKQGPWSDYEMVSLESMGGEEILVDAHTRERLVPPQEPQEPVSADEPEPETQESPEPFSSVEEAQKALRACGKKKDVVELLARYCPDSNLSPEDGTREDLENMALVLLPIVDQEGDQ